MNHFIRTITRYIPLLILIIWVNSYAAVTDTVSTNQTTLPNIIMLGKPGSGKGTLSASLVKNYGYIHLSVGNILRDLSKENTDLGLETRRLLKERKMMHGSIISKVLDGRIQDAINNKKKFILDGFPADEKQLHYFNSVISKHHLADNTIVIVINISDKEALNRIRYRTICSGCFHTYSTKTLISKNNEICNKCGAKLVKRNEDRIDKAKKRMTFYRQHTVPVFNLLNNNLKVYVISDANDPMSYLKNNRILD